MTPTEGTDMTLEYFSGPITKADAGGLEAVISTPRVDKDGESVDPLGLANRDEWLANPLIYWAHEWAYDPGAEPIGKGTRLDVSPNAITSAAVYAPTAKAQNVRALVLGGFVRKTSIGFDPLERKAINGTPTHTRWALREWSIVPMPANTDATITGVKSAVMWLAEQIADDEALVDAATLIDKAEEASLTLGNHQGAIEVHEGRHIIATIRPKRRATMRVVLPDTAYAAIDSRGRHYPHHKADGSLDTDALAAALAATQPGDLGRRHLEAHARAAEG